MAVESQQVLMVEGTLTPGTVLVSEVKEDDESEVNADILQQALQEASEEFDPQTNIEYENVENAVAVVHGDPTRPDEELDEGESDSNSNVNETIRVVTTETSTPGTVRVFATTTQSPEKTESTTTESTTPGAPIGSSQNPIQIIQQGNTYHSTQMLSQEQLAQIAQVLQQQQQLSQLSPNGSTSVLYNAATNTRIVYRIIYPSDIHGKPKTVSPGAVKIQTSITAGKGRGRPRKPWGKRFEDDEEKLDLPELSKDEKEEKKKHRPRTRSGRISKPPKHMMKDYKRIHHLDFDEDPYDDSDGGYSDYHVSGEDDENSRSSTSSVPTPGGVSTSKSRKYQCASCDKSYIGRGGLSRHYRLYPSHGNADDVEADIPPGTSAASMDGMLSGPATPAESGSQASNDAILSTSSTTANQVPIKRGRGRPSSQELASIRRKAKLKELIKQCENEELMETVLPRLAEAVSVWEFLLMKCEKGSPTRTCIPDICKELESLIKQAQKVAQEYMTLVPEDVVTNNDDNNNNGSKYEVTNNHLAAMLGISVGQYNVKEMQKPNVPVFQYKMLTTDPSEAKRTLATRRTVEVVSHEDIVVSPPAKRRRESTNTSSQDVSKSPEDEDTNMNSIPIQILQESQDDSIDYLPLTDSNNHCNNDYQAKSETTIQNEHLPSENSERKNGNSVENMEVVETTYITEETRENNQILTEYSNNVEKTENTAEGENENSTSIVLNETESSKLLNLSENGNSQYITLQDANGQTILGQVLFQRNEDGELVRQVVIQEGQILGSAQLEEQADYSEYSSNEMQPNVVIVQNSDGSTTTVQLASDQPLETVEALLAMDSEPQS